MKEIILYHGSVNIIEKPIYGEGKIYNDYGRGFYCTQNIELAKEWACTDNLKNGFVNKYSIDIRNLSVLDLTDKRYSILNWMAILVKNREFNITSSIARRGKQFLLDNYYIDTKKYDVIIGYRADDSYFRFAKDFLNNTISVQKLAKAMELGELGKQIALISKEAFDEIKFIESESVDKVYYTNRLARDIKAREKYYSINTEEEMDDIYLNDIMKGEKYEG